MRSSAGNEGLEISSVGFTVPLRHYHYDVFEVPRDLEGVRRSFGGMKIAFLQDKKGRVDRVSIPLESNVSDIVFERVPDEKLDG